MGETKEALIQAIVDLDLEMVSQIHTADPIDPKTFPAFKKMRWMTYSVLSEETLRAWLADLQAAKADGRNTMTEKYGRIDGQIPMFGDNPEIEEIAAQETIWQDEVAAKYPKTVQGHESNKSLFKRYMMCELESWSPEAIHSYWDDVQTAVTEGRNLAEERYDNLYRSLGKGSLKELNDSL